MTFIISSAQRKGGCGKTTIAIHVAEHLSHRGWQVFLIDADPQGSALHWAEPGHLAFPVRHLPVPKGNARGWVSIVRSAMVGYNAVLIDAPPHLDESVGAALALSDLALIPCGASSLDLRGLEQTLVLVNAVRTAHPLKVILVPTRADSRTLEGRHLRSELERFGEPIGPTIRESARIRQMTSKGTAIGAAHSRRREPSAGDDIVALSDVVEALMQSHLAASRHVGLTVRPSQASLAVNTPLVERDSRFRRTAGWRRG